MFWKRLFELTGDENGGAEDNMFGKH
jgi:hypothetical protein